MMKMYDLSIIIPVYKVEAFIEECIVSVLQINGICYEVIVVDDGTPDGSITCIGSYLQDSRIVLIHQENRGLSAARNTGLKAAKGKYVYFLDSDDFLDSRNFVSLFLAGKQEAADVIVGNFYDYTDREHCLPSRAVIGKESLIETGKNVLVKYYVKNIRSVVWRAIYKREFLEKHRLYFKEGVYFEDSEWSPRMYYFAEKVYYRNILFYYYRKRSNSIVNSSPSHKKFASAFSNALSLRQFETEIPEYKLKKLLEDIQYSYFRFILFEYKGGFTKNECRDIGDFLRKSKPLGVRNKFLGWLFFLLLTLRKSKV